ncbi:methionine ABC transporter ATP-binding protein [Labedella populi]|uniref:Methionine ABC transporter ATP-binding protein n=1 Tax=Labedella populi TaxID=2498850 RepID=A0A444QDC7_9MICO|nr:methionine ABC transporter ATP-binding protein [Labedella populi]RWZ64628.1 methionine ABC transporter ATP-binding protein [Labedella populi]
MPLVQIRDVTKVYPPSTRSGDPVRAIDGVDLDIEEGDVYGIIGYSGAGKSTLVRLVNALEPATSGSIVVDGTDITTLPERELRKLRLGIGMIFQQFNLFSSRTVRGNVAYPLQVAGRSRAETRKRVDELLDFVGLADKASNHPDELSGGQKQRVGIARALATSPRILLADEATSALDPETTQEVLGLLRTVNRDFGVTIIAITHEMDVVQSLATKVAVMESGRVVESGEVFEVFSRPRSPAGQRFVSTVVKGVPSDSELAALRERHAGRFVTVTFRDGGASQSEVFLEFGREGIGFELVYGGVNEIQGRAFGNLTLELTGAGDRVDAVIERLRRRVEIVEVV